MRITFCSSSYTTNLRVLIDVVYIVAAYLTLSPLDITYFFKNYHRISRALG